MGTCSFCGAAFPATRKTRKYCTNRCRTNACLVKKPRLRTDQLDELRRLLAEDFPSADAVKERLRSIIAPEQPPFPLVEGRAFIPRLD